MRKRKLISALALTLTLLCGITIGAGASGTLQEIKAYLNYGITIEYNGQEQVLKDAQGTRIFPVTYNDSTYLPVRGISNILGVAVDWDPATQTVKLGKQAGGVDLIDTYEIYYKDGRFANFGQVRSSEKKTENIAGVTHSNWIYLDTEYWNGNPTITNSISYNLLGKHETLTFSYYSTQDVTVKLLGDDGKLLGEYTITGGAVPKTVTVPLLHTNELKIEIDTPRNISLRIFDAKLDAE